ncbi:putative E3 ubiquitin-protein ligase LIN-1 isoform X1 [Arachis duranensis]|uniref:RING-type E3 ubiquitin transferase n=2 Tax=Arachis duranensis TaxID=130453 RepID=A0A6P4BJK2_ARADU|nr:putative E3 ubiquitin-protein ligase LIN-1 isoform X1 [Arachis duranensis]XP_015941044.1 putative E3 ubiquitin-protein ligase LIN-1 isoform X1 [Arachis duranensis]XP_020986584.1 putative E3 ubiquitin-protein ligase LIN-1 isoform X1 [Arachis duranensis]
MAGNFRFTMDQKDIVRILTTTIDSFIQDRLIDKELRAQHKEQCAERLAAEDGSSEKDTEVEYSDQAVLANLDWGIEALEEAINTYNTETKLARLDYAEKMLQVCAMLNPKQKTAGVPNFYLSAWAHLNLSYLWKLRNNIQNCVLHAIDMFIVDPFFARIDFAPELWKTLFLPHTSSIVGWYSEERHKLMMEVIPETSDFSVTADFDQLFNESLVFSLRPNQLDKLQKLEQLYGESLDENTRLYAKYYKDCMNSDSTTSGKKVVPMLPIAEPPMTPLHELSRSVPDYVKFGPILPKSAGFSLMSMPKDGVNEKTRDKPSSHSKVENSSIWGTKESIIEENENENENEEDSDSDLDDASVGSPNKNNVFSPERKAIKDNNIEPKVHLSNQRSKIYSPSISSPLDSPRTPQDKSSLNPHMRSKREPKYLCLLSSRLRDSIISDSLTSSPDLSTDHIMNSDHEMMVNIKKKDYNRIPCMSYENEDSLVLNDSSFCESDEGYHGCISLPKIEKQTTGSKPPKDFVCPITGQIFCDPVTLETGQTYERKAIQEWLKTGNTTCPITRQPLSASMLPKTNYVLKRLITSWKEQHPELAQEFSNSNTNTPRGSSCSPLQKDNSMLSILQRTPDSMTHKNKADYIIQRSKRFIQVAATSPTSVLSQAAVETIMNSMKPYISSLCTSENLQECEEAVLEIARSWKDAKSDPQIHSYLSKPTVINGLMEILSASLNGEVLRTTIYILTELIFLDESVGEILNSVDSDFDCLAALLKNGLAEAALLIYQLRPVFAQLSAHELIPSLVQVIQNKNEELDDFQLVMDPKDAAIAILEQILAGGDEYSRSLNALSVISANGIPALVKYFERMEVRTSVVSILLCCMQAERSCKNLIASRVELSPVLELFHGGNDSVKGVCAEFLSELVQLNRRTFCNQILQIIKDEGAFSTMHTFLVYLQMAPMEHQLAVASLLLQLDLLVEPRKMSIYREEAVETLIEALWQKDFSNTQIKALDALLYLIGHVTSSGKSYTEAWLLKIAGFDQPYNALMKAEQLGQRDNDLVETMEDEKNALNSWQKKVAFVLCNHENGSIFKALEECLRSTSLEMAKSCLVLATWLTHMLSTLPDTGIRDIARESLLDEFINVLLSSKNMEEKILANLALNTFISDPIAHEALGGYAKSIYRTLRKLKKHSAAAVDIMRTLLNLKSVDVTELWSCKEVVELDLSSNGEVLSLLYLNGQVLSGHSDGTIKVWDARKRIPRIIQETREHTKAVTSLCSSGDRLYSGSLDKTIRVWTIKANEIICIDVHDVKEAVYELTANARLACYVSQGTGAKVYNWSEAPKHINFSKYVKCLAVAGDKLYCGCSGYSIQEVDLSKHTSYSFFSGTRKLLGKQTIHALQIHDGFLYACGSSVDATAGKIFSLSTKMVVGSLSTGLDIHRVAINNDFIFAGTKFGTIEVWLKDKFTRVASIKMAGGNTKITSLVSDADGMMLFVGSSDGKIQVWALD